MFRELDSFNNGLTFEHVSQGVDDIRGGGLDLPVCHKGILIGHIESNVFPFHLSYLGDSPIIDWEVKFFLLLCLKFCKPRIDSVPHLIKILFTLAFQQVSGQLRIEIGYKTLDLNLKRISILIDGKDLDNGDLLVLF